MSKLTKKEDFLIKGGKSLDTINFCKNLKIPKEHLVWFVDRIEKESFSISSEKSKEYVKLVLKMFSKDKKTKLKSKTLSQAIFRACQMVETDESENERILYKFPDGHYIIQISHKEAHFEGQSMRNCMSNKATEIRNKDIAVLALKNKSSKTLSHIQIGKFGNMEDHFNFANSPVNFNSWKYINKFFEENKSLSFDRKLKDNGLNKIYSIDQQYEGLTVSSQLPYEKRVSFFDESIEGDSLEKFNSVFLKKHQYFNKKNTKNKTQLNIEETISYLENAKQMMLNSFQELENALNLSKNNFFILNEKMYYTIFGKKIDTIERFKGLVESIHEPKEARPLEDESHELVDFALQNTTIQESDYVDIDDLF
jgi:hypothetical protein